MRSFFSFVCGLGAALTLVVGVPALWVSQHVTSEDGYVLLMQPVITDGDLDDAVATELGSSLASRLPSVAQSTAKAAVVRVVRQVSGDPDFVTAWDQTNRRSHQIMFEDADELPSGVDPSNRLAIDLAPMADYVVKKVSVTGLPTLAVPDQIVVPLNGSTSTDDLRQVRRAPRVATFALVLSAALALASVSSARRRSSALAWLGLGAVVVAAVLKVAWHALLTHAVASSSAPSELGREVVQVVVNRATSSFDHSLGLLAVGGVVVAVLAGVARAVSAARA